MFQTLKITEEAMQSLAWAVSARLHWCITDIREDSEMGLRRR